MTVREIIKAWLDQQDVLPDTIDREIILQYLEDHNCDGLCNDDCGCKKDDLAPCGDMPADCVPGYYRRGDDGDWGIFETKEGA